MARHWVSRFAYFEECHKNLTNLLAFITQWLSDTIWMVRRESTNTSKPFNVTIEPSHFNNSPVQWLGASFFLAVITQ